MALSLSSLRQGDSFSAVNPPTHCLVGHLFDWRDSTQGQSTRGNRSPRFSLVKDLRIGIKALDMSVSREGTTRNCTLGSQCPPYSYRGTDLPNLNSHLNNKLLEDVVLHFQDSKAALDQRFRCSRDLLRRASPYFEVLLDPTKFNEGREVEHALQELLKDYPDITSIPIDKLPVVVIKDVGEIPAKDSHRMTALCLFIKILQDVKFGRIDEWIKGSVEPLTLVTLLAIIADRFEAKERVSKHVKRMDKKLFEDGKKDRGPGRKEINRRKRILTGMLLGLPDWARPSSASLICEGSEYWMQDNLAPNAQEIESNEEPLWCRLPGGMEGQQLGKFPSSCIKADADCRRATVQARMCARNDLLPSEPFRWSLHWKATTMQVGLRLVAAM